MPVKLMSLTQAVALVENGACVGLGGNTLNRAPLAAAMEMARQNKRGLRLVKTAGAMDIDLLCLAGCVACVDAGFVSHESWFSLCRHYRQAVEQGTVTAHEHACYTVISALRAAAYGIPFMPVRGLKDSGLTAANDYFVRVKDPFSQEELFAVQAIRPDWAVIHVQQADEEGNARIDGPLYDDLLLARAAKRVLVTAENIVPGAVFDRSHCKAQIAAFEVAAVCHVARGAQPGACHGHYAADAEDMAAYLKLTDAQALQAWIEQRQRGNA